MDATEGVPLELFAFREAGRHRFRTGESLSIRMAYRAKVRIEDPVFGIAIHRSDGVHVTGTNTAMEGLHISPLQGGGQAECVLKAVPLNPGGYFLSVAVHDRDENRSYDYHDRLYPFEIAGSREKSQGGLISIRNVWDFT